MVIPFDKIGVPAVLRRDLAITLAGTPDDCAVVCVPLYADARIGDVIIVGGKQFHVDCVEPQTNWIELKLKTIKVVRDGYDRN